MKRIQFDGERCCEGLNVHFSHVGVVERNCGLTVSSRINQGLVNLRMVMVVVLVFSVRLLLY